MPEGPEVRNIVDVLDEEVTSYTLSSINYNTSSRYNKKDIPYLEQLHTILPLKITGVYSRGKKIIFALEEDIYLISSLMMEGKWSWKEGKHSDLWFNLYNINKKIRFNRKLYFDDSRHFGTLEVLMSREELDARLAMIGPDLLLDDIDISEWKTKIRSNRIKRKKIGLFLMEQKYFSGIGNYLRAEILYEAKISPHRSLELLDDKEIEDIFYAARKIIRESYEARGFTLSSYWDPHSRKGEYRVKIYGHKLDPLGNPIIAEKFDDKRTVHWVPNIQI